MPCSPLQLLSHGALLDEPDDDGDTPLSTASFHGAVNTVSLLLNKGADKNVVNRYGRTMFSAACQGV